MKIQSITSELTPYKRQIAHKGVVLAAGICAGIILGSVHAANQKHVNNNVKEPTPVYYENKTENYGRAMLNMSNSLEVSKKPVQVPEKFNNKQTLKEQGKTKHWFRAKNGPDKGSKFYRSSEYTFFGYYKG